MLTYSQINQKVHTDRVVVSLDYDIAELWFHNLFHRLGLPYRKAFVSVILRKPFHPPWTQIGWSF
jgi:hypothetical protein